MVLKIQFNLAAHLMVDHLASAGPARTSPDCAAPLGALDWVRTASVQTSNPLARKAFMALAKGPYSNRAVTAPLEAETSPAMFPFPS